jgi:hypothetical protein
VSWSASGGAIDAAGVFTAGTDEGNFLVRAASGTIQTTASVRVAKSGGPGPTGGEKDDGGGQVVETAVSGLTWKGDVPAQKWMNFYTKVLSKLAPTAKLKLTVAVEFAPGVEIADQKVDDVRVALKELGLPDDVGTS